MEPASVESVGAGLAALRCAEDGRADEDEDAEDEECVEVAEFGSAGLLGVVCPLPLAVDSSSQRRIAEPTIEPLRSKPFGGADSIGVVISSGESRRPPIPLPAPAAVPRSTAALLGDILPPAETRTGVRSYGFGKRGASAALGGVSAGRGEPLGTTAEETSVPTLDGALSERDESVGEPAPDSCSRGCCELGAVRSAECLCSDALTPKDAFRNAFAISENDISVCMRGTASAVGAVICVGAPLFFGDGHAALCSVSLGSSRLIGRDGPLVLGSVGIALLDLLLGLAGAAFVGLAGLLLSSPPAPVACQTASAVGTPYSARSQMSRKRASSRCMVW